MKKMITAALLLLPALVSAQNIQLHYDLGKPENADSRNFFVGTFEFFRPDTLGYTFLFTDFEFNAPYSPSGVSLGYFEISREFYMPWFKNSKSLRELGLHIEYNDGNFLYQIPGDSMVYGDNINRAWLAGFGYPLKLGGFTLNTMVLYKHIRGSDAPDVQLTLAWFHMFWNNRITFTGFLDVWSQDELLDNSGNKIAVLYAEPQLWFNLTDRIALGGEFKLSKNFVPFSERLEIFPTVGARYQF